MRLQMVPIATLPRIRQGTPQSLAPNQQTNVYAKRLAGLVWHARKVALIQPSSQ